jgi:hypothetical protein
MDDHLRSRAPIRSPFAEIYIDESWPPELASLLHRIEQKEAHIMTAAQDAQATIDAATAAFTALLDQASATAADLAVVATKLSQWIAEQPAEVDTTGLAALTGRVTDAAAQLVTAQGGVDALLSDDPTTSADGLPAVAAGSASDAAGAVGSLNTDPTAAPTPAPVTPLPAPADADPADQTGAQDGGDTATGTDDTAALPADGSSDPAAS